MLESLIYLFTVTDMFKHNYDKIIVADGTIPNLAVRSTRDDLTHDLDKLLPGKCQ